MLSGSQVQPRLRSKISGLNFPSRKILIREILSLRDNLFSGSARRFVQDDTAAGEQVGSAASHPEASGQKYRVIQAEYHCLSGKRSMDKLFLRKLKSNWVFLVFILALTAVCLIYIKNAEIGFDEGFNLQIPLNLLGGHGYATTSGGFFDPNITTGFPVLLPVTLSLSLLKFSIFSARMVMVLYFILYCTCIYLLFSRMGMGLYAGIAACLFIVALSSIFSFGLTVLGEVPGAALSLIGLLFLCKKKPLPAGIFFALGTITKVIFLLLIGPVLIVYMYEALINRKLHLAVLSRIREPLIFLFGYLGTALTYILVIFISLGKSEFLKVALGSFSVFTRFQGGVDISQENTGRVSSFLTPFSSFLPIVGICIILCIIVISVYLFSTTWFSNKTPGDKRTYLFWVATILCFIGWWFLSSSSDWYRHIFAAYLFIMPFMGGILSLLIVRSLADLKTFNHTKIFPTVRLFITLGISLVMIAILAAGLNHEKNKFLTDINNGSLKIQEAFAEKITVLHNQGAYLAYWGWWQAPEISFLSRIQFYNLAKDTERTTLVKLKDRGIPVYCISTPVQQMLDPDSITWLLNVDYCEPPASNNGGYRIYKFILVAKTSEN
jgi:hypothetical protein